MKCGGSDCAPAITCDLSRSLAHYRSKYHSIRTSFCYQDKGGSRNQMTTDKVFENGFRGLLQQARNLGLCVGAASYEFFLDAYRRPKIGRKRLAYLYVRWYLDVLATISYRMLFLRRVAFIGITGSTGKTMTKELVSVVLSSQLKGRRSNETRNRLHTMLGGILRLRPWDDFLIQEISGKQYGKKLALEQTLSLIKPNIAVVTNVGTDHISVFGSVQKIAEEKSKLVACIPRNGTVILNVDDPLVRAMEQRARGRVITCGTAIDAEFRAVNIQSNWPNRLSFAVLYNSQKYHVRTQLLGTQWVTGILASIAVGLTLGISITDSIRALETAQPIRSRMYPVFRPDGVTFIQDDFKVTPASCKKAFEFMAHAKAARKIVIVGTLSDYLGASEKAYSAAAREALTVADVVVFIGRWAHKCLTVQRNHPKGYALYSVPQVKNDDQVLNRLLRPGDLVLVKASWRLDNTAALLETPLALSGQSPTPPQHKNNPHDYPTSPEDLKIRAIVGLGNFGERYENTRHNIGFKVLDVLARELKGEWRMTKNAAVATIQQDDRELHLIKPISRMNCIGEVLSRIRMQFNFDPVECLLVFDDTSLPVGTTRFRMKGGYGGHLGCLSVTNHFGTTIIPRVRIGVGKPEEGVSSEKFVLNDFPSEDLPQLAAASSEAVGKIVSILHNAGKEAS